jgi:glutamyl-tRNA(Gln) amidotransferase subunit E
MSALPLPPFEQATDADYAAVGFRCGLEVHQQLLTRSKLFCRCPAGHYSSAYDAEVLRHMRPTLSEMGEYDGTALMEKKTRKNIIYRLHHATVCTYEFDDTPPFFMDEQAIDIAIELALLLRLNLVDELHVARKQYLDGSIPTGFQRTTILGVDGWIPYGDRRIGVRQLGLEEDSCREVCDVGHDRVYLTDRLGMPLVEVVTEPDMRTPREAAEVCTIIGRLLRSTQKVRRGYGATRQDVNVSVSGGTRVEIKGVPQIWRIPRLVYNEASRQLSLLRIRDELRRRGVTEETLRVEHHDVTELLGATPYAPVRSALGAGRRVRCVRLAGFGGLLSEHTQEHTVFAKEFSDRVRVVACLTELPNMAHSDAASESLPARDWQGLRRRMHAAEADALLVVWGDERDTLTAAGEIEIRAREAIRGVPSDTRQALRDGTSGFERVLPGPQRMYPDTDLPPIVLLPQRIERVRQRLPEHVWDVERRFREAGMPLDDAARLSISPLSGLATRALRDHGLGGALVGVVLSQRLRAQGRRGLRPQRLSEEALEAILALHASGRLPREGIDRVLVHLLRGPGDGALKAPEVATAMQDMGLHRLDGEAAAARVDALVAQIEPRAFPTPQKLQRALMGRLMADLAGRVEGRRVAELVRAALARPEAARAPRSATAATVPRGGAT